MQTLNYRKISDLIHTSGQPNADEFPDIAALGVKTLINLALPDSEKAIPEEGVLVSAQGMNYVHIPVVWQSPQPEQYALFESVMRAHPDSGVWIHCALNWRVSSFVYLYRLNCLGVAHEEAVQDMHSLWTPNEVWSDFIQACLR